MTESFGGILTALATPFDESGKVDDTLLRRLVDRSVDGGVDALVVGGGTGEFTTLSEEERLHLFDVVVEHTAGRVPVVAQTGAITTSAAIRLSRAAERTGADVLMLSLPYYEPLSPGEVRRYITEVAGSVELPIMLYNNPSTTGVNMDAGTLAAFGREIENVRYVKDSSKDWEQALRLIHHHSDDIGLIMGWDSYSFSALLEGATGVMVGAANVVPEEISAVARAIRAGDVATAREEWRRVYPVIDAMLAVPFVQAVKAGLRLRGEPVGAPREPLEELAPEDVASLEAALNALYR
ncbi:dihydrodipicolinate synthase family protein [Pseudonocardia sp. C8]|uniref:dihydrodipicolinate synthase family protein n=1 Tax=Pseudonocardia sp. C8 TaxID=2762759 RepID=UPI001643077B|nr:dihydrodipicolinate synthase family protein [Pseudonocardia sp. C8]MBC3193396.1 dihydrodipicolinate synthase family protein [Pseudonocardia sp. C8]